MKLPANYLKNGKVVPEYRLCSVRLVVLISPDPGSSEPSDTYDQYNDNLP